MKTARMWGLVVLLAVASGLLHGQSSYPRWTVPAEKQIRVVIDSDAGVEADDQAAISYALLSPSLIVRGLIAAHFRPLSNSQVKDPLATMEASFRELHDLLTAMGVSSCVPVFRGGPHGFPDPSSPVPSEGAEFLIKEAMAEDSRPLYGIFLGPLTDLASAYRKNPAIAKRLTVIWIGGAPYPDGGVEYNQDGDRIAANIVMESEIPLYQIPMNIYLLPRFGLAEIAEKVGKQGELGAFLFSRVMRFITTYPMLREYFQYADPPAIHTALQLPWISNFDAVAAPSITSEGVYRPNGKNRAIRVIRTLDSRAMLEDMFAKYAAFARHDISANCIATAAAK